MALIGSQSCKHSSSASNFTLLFHLMRMENFRIIFYIWNSMYSRMNYMQTVFAILKLLSWLLFYFSSGLQRLSNCIRCGEEKLLLLHTHTKRTVEWNAISKYPQAPSEKVYGMTSGHSANDVDMDGSKTMRPAKRMLYRNGNNEGELSRTGEIWIHSDAHFDCVRRPRPSSEKCFSEHYSIGWIHANINVSVNLRGAEFVSI